MLIPRSYGNALMYLVASSNQSSGYISGQSSLTGSNIGGRRPNQGYSNFDLSPQARQSNGGGAMFVARWGLSRGAFPARSDWSWRSVIT